MKDFQQIIEHGQLPPNKVETHTPVNRLQQIRDQLLPFVSPFLLSIVTAPFTTASVFLQITSKGSEKAATQAKINSNPQLERHITNGLFGDNRIYCSPTLNGYKDTLSQLGKQGVRGIYKGNLTGLLLASSNTWLRSTLYKISSQSSLVGESILSTNLITVATCTLADLISLPLMTAQSRLILQNSSPLFRTYRSFLSVLRKSSPSLLFSGGSLVLVKNIIFDLTWIKLIPESPAYSFILSSTLSHILTYPFVTVMRQLQVNELGVPMLQQRKENVRACTARLWNEGRLLSFYRGFFAYVIVHLFIGALMVQANLRSGYFNQQ